MVNKNSSVDFEANIGVEDPPLEKDGNYIEVILSRVTAAKIRIMEMVKNTNRFSERAIFSTRLALEEAIPNSIYHGNLERDSSLRKSDDTSAYDRDLEKQSAHMHDRTVDVQVLFHYKETAPEHNLVDTNLETGKPSEDEKDAIGESIDTVSVRVAEDIQNIAEISGVTIIMRDGGPGFNPNTLADPTDDEHVDAPCGRGVMLIRNFMDEVRYNETGNEVTMSKGADQAAV